MIGYITLGTNDLKKSGEYFDKLFAPLGAKRLLDLPRGIFWGTGFDRPFIGLMTPSNGEPANVGNGTMVAIAAKDRAQVDAFYAHALANGCTCEGAPGERMPGFYAAYFRTPEGHKMNMFKMG
ncbi:MAG TPA: VOC family protein [Limnobacter sp.]|nr:VOC family protein [Limnobacter sp.]